MIIVISVLVISLALFAIAEIKGDEDWNIGAWVITGVVGGGVLLALLISPLTIKGEARQFNAVQQTLTNARENRDISAIELAAIQTEVIKANCWLADTQYYGKNPFTSWFVPRGVMKLTPIK